MKILIFNPLHIFFFDETSLENGALGGSETWTVQITDEFQKLGHQCYNVCWCGKSHIAKNGAYYIDRAEIDKIIGIKFDFAISVRLVSFFYKLLQTYQFTNRFFLLLADTSCPDVSEQILIDKRLDKVITLTPWHYNLIKNKYKLSDYKICIIPNGIDVNIFNKVCTYEKPCDHSIFWSSRAERGLKILSQDIQPLVRKQIPDFTVRTSVYSDNPDFQYEQLDVEVLKPLSKAQLYSEMYKHCVWFYLSVFDETFCITAIENIMCRNDLVLYPKYGTISYSDFSDNLNIAFTDSARYKDACQAAANKLVWHIQNYENRKNIDTRNRAYDYVMNNFQWNIIANKFIKLAST